MTEPSNPKNEEKKLRLKEILKEKADMVPSRRILTEEEAQELIFRMVQKPPHF